MLGAIWHLKGRGLSSVGVIIAYHTRGVAPIMVRGLTLHEMGPTMSSVGSALAEMVPGDSEVRQRIREAIEGQDPENPVPGHPVMCPDTGYIEMVSSCYWSVCH